jgi:hypothetical protein
MREHPDHAQQRFPSDGRSIEFEDACNTTHINSVLGASSAPASRCRGALFGEPLHFELASDFHSSVGVGHRWGDMGDATASLVIPGDDKDADSLIKYVV